MKIITHSERKYVTEENWIQDLSSDTMLDGSP
jgi:hypothetical protein